MYTRQSAVSGPRATRVGVNSTSPGNLKSGHRALAAREPVTVARPLRGAAPYTFSRDVVKNTVYRSLALKTAKKRAKTVAEIS